MNGKGFWIGLAVGIIATSLFGQWVLAAAGRAAAPSTCIPAETVAGYVHSVIQADRTFYTTDIVERMQMRGIVFASENWRETARLPLPAQFLIETGRLMAAERGGLRYRLISNWPINKKNRPSTDFERAGLTEILVNSDQPYTAVTTEGGAPVFQALYADKAVSQSCVGCHNAHPDSPKKDFKPQDVMGGILLTIPLPR
ncbi:Tll0287-like domain-containing protein [Nitrospira sp. NS4]|uniref:Tll0287-like domain-containing protein n=1 Tax=Nitrospira sp. NS4 TaxID=3414498 RepID=UPI003C2EE7C6